MAKDLKKPSLNTLMIKTDRLWTLSKSSWDMEMRK